MTLRIFPSPKLPAKDREVWDPSLDDEQIISMLAQREARKQRFTLFGHEYYRMERKCMNCGAIQETAHPVGTESPLRVQCEVCDLEYATRRSET